MRIAAKHEWSFTATMTDEGLAWVARLNAEIRRQVFERDGGCVMHALIPGHVCRDIFGNEHAWDDLDRCSYEHVKLELRMGKRAEDDVRMGVTLCGYENNRPPSKVLRAMFREHLRGLYE